MFLRHIFCVAILATSGCDSTPTPADADAVYEAAFRKYLGQRPVTAAGYLVVEGHDPSAELLDRMHTTWPNLQPASKEPPGGEYHITVRDLKWANRNAATLRLSMWMKTKAAPEGYHAEYHLIRRDGTWTVEKVTSEAIS